MTDHEITLHINGLDYKPIETNTRNLFSFESVRLVSCTTLTRDEVTYGKRVGTVDGLRKGRTSASCLRLDYSVTDSFVG